MKPVVDSWKSLSIDFLRFDYSVRNSEKVQPTCGHLVTKWVPAYPQPLKASLAWHHGATCFHRGPNVLTRSSTSWPIRPWPPWLWFSSFQLIWPTRCVLKEMFYLLGETKRQGIKTALCSFWKQRTKPFSFHNFLLDMCTSSVLPEVYRYMNRGLFERDKMMFKHRAWTYDVFPEPCSHMAGVPSEAHGCSEDFSGQWWPALSWADYPSSVSSMSSMSCLRRAFTCIIAHLSIW